MAGGDKGGSQKPRCKGPALELRLDAVESLITQGYTSKEVRKACITKWELSPRQAEEYISKVYSRWSSESHRTRADARERQTRRLMRLYRKAEGDVKAQVMVENILTRIEGTEYRPTDDVAGVGHARIVIQRKRNPDVPPPEAA